MVNEGLITQKSAVARIEPAQLFQLLLPSFEIESKEKAIQEGTTVTVDYI